jgi:hypothetical protein
MELIMLLVMRRVYMEYEEKEMIEKINEIMRRYLWMDFELTRAGTDKVVLHGFLDEAEEDKIQIVFSDVDAILCKTSFTFEGEKEFLKELDGEKARTVNLNYSILQGMKIFQILNTDIEGEMYIIAKNVDYIV